MSKRYENRPFRPYNISLETRMRRVLQYLSRPIPSWAIAWRHEIYATLGQHTILVYTMGKVGSKTVYDSLRHNCVSPLVYHVHFLTKSNIQSIARKYERSGISSCNRVSIGQLLKGKFGHFTASYTLSRISHRNTKWFLISLIRDPVATFFSHVFQNPHIHRPQLLGQDGRLDQKLVENYIINHYSNFDPENDYISNWFSDEFLGFTSIDVYDHEFDSSVGYGVIKEVRFDVAIVALEHLEQSLPAAISEILGKKHDLKIVSTNIRSSMAERDLYQNIKNQVVIPRDSLIRVYSTKYAKHFFSSEYVERMLDKWSKPRIANG